MNKCVIRIQRGRIGENLYAMALFIYIFASCFFNRGISTVTSSLLEDSSQLYIISCLVSFLLLAIKTIVYSTKKDFPTIAMLVLLMFLSFIFSQNILLAIGLIFVISGKNVDFDRIIKIEMIALSICIGAVAFMAVKGFVTHITYINGGEISAAYGFINPNTFAAALFEVCMMALYLQRKKMGVWTTIGIFMIAVGNYALSKSRTPFFISCFVCSILFIYVFLKANKIRLKVRWDKIIGFGVFFFAGLFFITIKFNIDFFQKNGSLLSSRLGLIYSYYKQYGLSLLGKPIVTQAGRTLDVAYVYILLAFGLVFFFLFLYCYIKLIMFYAQKKDYVTILIIVAYLIYGIAETTLLRVEFNFTLLLINLIVWSPKEKLKENAKKLIHIT